MCQELRRNSPSVADWRPTSSCMATTSAMASSSTARNWSAEMRPAACCSRATRSRGGRRRLPTWSARYGGVVRSTVTSLVPLQGRLILPASRTGTDATRADDVSIGRRPGKWWTLSGEGERFPSASTVGDDLAGRRRGPAWFQEPCLARKLCAGSLVRKGCSQWATGCRRQAGRRSAGGGGAGGGPPGPSRWRSSSCWWSGWESRSPVACWTTSPPRRAAVAPGSGFPGHRPMTCCAGLRWAPRSGPAGSWSYSLSSRTAPPIPSGRPPDGLACNPATGRWRALPEPPPDQSIGGGRVGAVWTGKEVILLYATGAPIAYDPDANTWRRSARPPTGFISHAADPAPIWTGAEVLVWDGSNIDDTSGKRIDGGRGAAYNRRPTAGGSCPGRRSATEPGQSRPGPASCCWSSPDRVAMRDRSAAWTAPPTTPPPTPGHRSQRWPVGAIAPEAAAAWTGSELVIWSATTSKDGLRIRNAARAYNPRTKRWRTLPPAPIAPRRLAAAVWAGDRLLVWGGIQNIRADKLAYPDDGAAYDPRSNRWQP